MDKNLSKNAENEALLSEILSLAKQEGASAAEVSIQTGKGFCVSVRMGEVDTLEHQRDKSISLTVYIGQKTGHVSFSDFSLAAIKNAVNKACSIAKFTQEDSYSGLADKNLLAFNYPQLDLYHPWDITEEKAILLAKECEQLARAEDKRIVNSEGASVSTYDTFYAYANSEGFIGSYATSDHGINCALVAFDGHEMQRDYDYTHARDFHDLEDINVLAKRVRERTVNRLGARKIQTRTCPIILSHEMARGFINHLIRAISGGNLYRKSSFLLDQLGKSIFPSFMNIEEQPHLPKQMGSTPFDNDGVKTNAKKIIQEGILSTYLLGTYSAKKLGMQSTGNAGGANNVIVKSTSHDFSELLREMNTGLLVTELIGQGVNLVTGDYSRGAFGYWVENGEIQYPVQEITIAGNLKEMFQNIVGISRDVDRRGNIATGSILLSEMTIAGN